MAPEVFSVRHNLRASAEQLIYDDIPTSVRNGFKYIFDDYARYINAVAFIDDYCEAAGKPHAIYVAIREKDSSAKLKFIRKCIETSVWWEFLDICELFSSAFYKSHSSKRGQFSVSLNSLFKKETIGYEMREGKIHRIGNEFTDERIREAKNLLKDPLFRGADKHFSKAVEAINVRPKPDIENSIKDAVSAIESVGRVIANDDNITLRHFIEGMVAKELIPQPLDQVIQKIYAYRGNEPGIAHGSVGLPKVTIDEAEFILALSAATIIYLVSKKASMTIDSTLGR